MNVPIIPRKKIESTTVLVLVALMLAAGTAGHADALEAVKNEYLDLDITQLMNITVTSVAKKEQRLADAPAAVFVITQEDIHRSGVTTIPDALAMAPGLQVAKISASKWSVSSRGFAGYTSNKLLVLIDGRSVYSPAYSGTFWDSQNTLLEDVDRIEVIRGPGGTLWGANAVNGVINIITKKAEDTQGGLLRVGGGDQEPFMAAARYGGKISDTTFGRLYLTYNDHASNSLEEGGGDAEDGWQPVQGGFRVDGSPDSSKQWTLQGDLFETSGDQILSPYWISQPPFQTTLIDTLDNKGGNLLGRWRQELSADSALTVKAYYDYVNRNDALFNWQYDTFDFDLQYETRLGQRQNLTMGTGYRSVQGDVHESFQVYLPDRNDNLYNAFLQDEINLLADAVWLTLGTKYEHNDYTGSEWQPSAKLLWKPAERHSLWTSVSRAVRTPAVVEQYGRVTLGAIPTPSGIGFINVVGNPDFTSEILWAYEAGYRWQARENLSFDLALFYNDYEDVYGLAPSLSATGYNLQFINEQSGAGKGFELAADWKPSSWLSFACAYSYLDMNLSSDNPISKGITENIFNRSSPQQQASVRSSIALAENWRLNLWLRYVDTIYGLNRADLTGQPVEIDGYFLLDANLTWTPLKNLEVMLVGQNLTSDSQLEYIAEIATPPTAIDRGVYGKVTWRF